jgi:hypothetical protein
VSLLGGAQHTPSYHGERWLILQSGAGFEHRDIFRLDDTMGLTDGAGNEIVSTGTCSDYSNTGMVGTEIAYRLGSNHFN